MKLPLVTLALATHLVAYGNMFSPETVPPAPLFGTGTSFITGPWYSIDNTGYELQNPSTNPDYKGRFWPILVDTKGQAGIYVNYYCQYPGAIVWASDWHTPNVGVWNNSQMIIQSYNFDTKLSNTTSWAELALNHTNPWYKFYINDTGYIQVLWVFQKDSRTAFLQGKFESPQFVPILPANVLWVQRTSEGDYVAMSQAAYNGSVGTNPLLGFLTSIGPGVGSPGGSLQVENVPNTASTPIPQTRVYFIPITASGYRYSSYQINLMGTPVATTPHNQVIGSHFGQQIVIE